MVAHIVGTQGFSKRAPHWRLVSCLQLFPMGLVTFDLFFGVLSRDNIRTVHQIGHCSIVGVSFTHHKAVHGASRGTQTETDGA